MLAPAIFCLALNIYFEARNQPLEGQIAVSQVVLNRVDSQHYPDDVCEVVRDAEYYLNGKIKKHRCQFSWYCDGKVDHPKDIDAFRWALLVAESIFDNPAMPDFVDGATHYHATHVRPEWANRAIYIVTIGDHVFYKFKKSKIKQ